MNRNIYISSILLVLTLALWSCHAVERESYHTVRSKIHKLEHSGDTSYGVSSLDHLEYLKTVKTDSTFTEESFLIPERTSEIMSYQCSNCHSLPLDKLKAVNNDKKKAHWDFKLQHANSSAMNCVTCHTPNNMDSLHTITGELVSFDHSYKVCASCHSTQFKDWKLGAHGKRLGGWAPPRVSNTCVNCHNPHKPGFAKRHPARLNNKMLEEHRTIEGSGH